MTNDFPGKAKVRPDKDALLLSYQRKWVTEGSRMKIAEKSRQIGWTWSTAYAIARRGAAADARLDTWITSRDEGQAMLLIEDIKNFSRVLQIGAKDLGSQVLDEKGNGAHVIQFASGVRAFSMSSNPNAQAGKRGHRVADEFALHEQQRFLYTIMKPGVTWGGMMEIFSTHRGTASFFNQLINEVKHKGNPKKFSLHTVTLQDALDAGFLYRLQQKLYDLDPSDDRIYMDEAEYFDNVRSEMPDEETFLQEYMCIPSDDASAFLSYELIQACEYKPGEDWQTDLADTRNPLYVGVDVGRQHDLTVIWVLEAVSDSRFTRRVIELKRATFDEQEAELYEILRLPQVRRCCIDNTGIGRQFAERAEQRFGRYRVEPVNFTAPVKEELAYPLRAAFEDRTVRIPNSDYIRADLRAVKKESTASGNVRFTADRGKNGHSDRFWALALALHAGKATGVAGMPQPFSRNRVSQALLERRNREVLA